MIQELDTGRLISKYHDDLMELVKFTSYSDYHHINGFNIKAIFFAYIHSHILSRS